MRHFSSVFDWFVDKKLSIHIGQEKTKSILFGTKHKLRNVKYLNFAYNYTEIKLHAKVKYLGYILEESLSGESMTLNVIDKIDSTRKLLYKQNVLLTPPLRRLSCNALIKPIFHYTCTSWFPNLSNKLRLRI